MKWYHVNEFLPGQDTGWVIVRAYNSDGVNFIYQAIFRRGEWEIWNYEYFPDDELDDLTIAHWTYFPKHTELFG